MSQGMKKGLFPVRSLGLGMVLVAVGWIGKEFHLVYGLLAIVIGILFATGRIWYWVARGRHGAKASIARSERKQERSGGVQSRWEHMRDFSATSMRLRWARSLQPGRDDLDGLRGLIQIFCEPVDEYATCIGTSNYGKKYVPHNSVTVRIAGARSGKSVGLADRILRHPGPVVATSTRTDLVDMTAELRTDKGPIYIFNAGEIGNINSTLKWSVLSGCKDMTTAKRRASDLIGPIQEGTDAANWQRKAVAVLAPLMYAAAHANLRMRDVASWIAAGEMERPQVWARIKKILLERTPDGHFAVNQLHQHFNTNDRTLTSVTNSMTEALAWLTNPATAALGDAVGSEEFDIERNLIDLDGTIYILGKRGPGVGALTGALIAEIMEVARVVASRREGGRLSPALLMALDELALTCPGPVHDWVLDMGGFGITGDFCVQQRASLDEIWGVNGRSVILGNSLVVLFGAGCNQADVASDFSTMSGTRTETRRSYSYASGKKELSGESEIEVSVVDPGKLMALTIGRAIWFTRGRVDEVQMMRADKRKDVKRIVKARRVKNNLIRQHVDARLAEYEGREQAERWYAEEGAQQ
jgi:type IV secretion system protein VirD4